MAMKDKSGATDKVDLPVTGPDDYDGSKAPTKYAGNSIECPACGKVAVWDNQHMGKGWRCPKGHLTRPGQ